MKSQAVIKPKLKPKFFLLNCLPAAELGQINFPVFGGPCPGEAQRESRDPQHDGHPGRGVCLGRFSQPTGGAPAVAVDPFGSHESHQEPNSIENMLA